MVSANTSKREGHPAESKKDGQLMHLLFNHHPSFRAYLEDSCQAAVLLRGRPHVALAPHAQVAQFLHLDGMVGGKEGRKGGGERKKEVKKGELHSKSVTRFSYLGMVG